MAFFDRLFGARHTTSNDTTTKSTHRPVWTRVGPGNAVSTPRRYDRMADEGYRQNVVAYRAVNLVAKAVASIPMVLKRGDQVVNEHPLLSLLKKPNPRLRGENFLYNFVGYYMIAGNAYALKVGPDGAAPKELWLLRPDTMQVIEGADGLPGGYEQQVAGKKQRFDTGSVLHMKTFNPLSDWYGLAPLEAAAMAVDAHNEGSRWNLALIQNGGTPSGVLYQEDADMPLTDAQFTKLKDQIEQQYTGAINAGRPLLLEGGLKWQDMGMSPKDMDWASAKNMTAREIATAFGVPAQMMGVPDAQTYSNYGEARQSLWEDTVIPLACEIAQEMTNWLLPDFEPAARPGIGDTAKLLLALDLDDVPALEAKRAERFSRIANAAFLSDDEKRTALGFKAKQKKK
jgi:HK97 family phage portal protein